MKKNQYFKGAMPTGWDFHTGNTINYRDNVGKIVHVPEKSANPTLCSSSVLHASKLAQNIFIGSNIPCSLFIVEGTPVVEDKEKSGFKEFYVREEVPVENFDQLFGFKYSEVLNPLDPRKIEFEREVTTEEITLVEKWASMRASVRDSVRASVWASVWDSEAAYIGSIFTSVKTWKYTENLKIKGYPFQSAVELLKMGLVPVYDGTKWYLVHPLSKGAGRIVWSGQI